MPEFELPQLTASTKASEINSIIRAIDKFTESFSGSEQKKPDQPKNQKKKPGGFYTNVYTDEASQPDPLTERLAKIPRPGSSNLVTVQSSRSKKLAETSLTTSKSRKSAQRKKNAPSGIVYQASPWLPPRWLLFSLWTFLGLVAVVVYFFVYALVLVPGGG